MPLLRSIALRWAGLVTVAVLDEDNAGDSPAFTAAGNSHVDAHGSGAVVGAATDIPFRSRPASNGPGIRADGQTCPRLVVRTARPESDHRMPSIHQDPQRCAVST